MQTGAFVDRPNRDTEHPESPPAIRVVIAFNDLAAGRRAMRVLARLNDGLGDPIQLHPLPWSFHLLADADWREMAANDVVAADILIIATADKGPLPPAIQDWAEQAILIKRGSPTAVVALFGPEAEPDHPDSSRVRAIEAVARESGLAFFAPGLQPPREDRGAPRPRPTAADRPMFDDLLRYESPDAHWGLSE